MRYILALTITCLVITCVLPGEPAPRPQPKDEQDLIYFERDRPARIRLHLQVEGKSFQAHWDEIMGQLFRFLDADGDARLNIKEADHAPSERQLRQMILGVVELEADAAPKFAELTDDAKSVTIEQLKGYYHRVGVAPWHIDWVARNSSPVHLDDELFARLNPANQERLPLGVLKEAGKLTRLLDVDDDEMVAARELKALDYFGGFLPAAPLRAKSGPFFMLDPSDKGRALLAKEIVHQYDRDKNGKLDSKEIAFESGQFRNLDGNKNGFLDLGELTRWPDEPADLAILLRLDGAANNSLFLIPDERGRPRRLAAGVRKSQIGSAEIVSGDEIIEFLRADGLNSQQRRLETMGLNQFKILDRNQDEVLDSAEVYQPPFAFVSLLRLADPNGDGKVAMEEFQSFVSLQKKMVTRAVVVSILDRGRQLFDLLDTDHDHRLGRRELIGAAARLAPWIDKSSAIERGKLPRQYQVIVSQGALPRFNGDPGAVAAGRPESRLGGPLWFRKMDRNADGDVSEGEFFGETAKFRELDIDGDGLIGLAEAVAASAKK